MTPKARAQEALEMPEHYKMVSDAEIDAAWGNANFGENADRREIIADTLLKYAGGFSSGNTAVCICRELGLLGKYRADCDIKLTKKGQKYLYWAFENRRHRNTPSPAINQELADALRFYANPQNYAIAAKRSGMEQSNIDRDIGDVARKALEKHAAAVKRGEG